eukprot:CAMPEP_0198199388 /NCGR_PEP_ID=MMETSP1445-20131203/2702_1 /TAXON_ID=36898 /ORGANISM="Pyramimonas sp., Strain CCMP2087" /LENGTH=287 /DNA_ID=CAMNT_0043869227 /DNA_START=197 /DNA_END=1056 /DNA_ORIENTATION=+
MAGVMGEPPRALVCPITLDLLCDPVVDANGHTFDRGAIERSLELRPGKSPKTNAPYPDGSPRLTPNYTVREMVDTFLEAAGEGVEPKRIRVEKRERAQREALRRRTQLQVARELAAEAERERRMAEVQQAERIRMARVAEAPRRAFNFPEAGARLDQLEHDRNFGGLVLVLVDASSDDATKMKVALALKRLARDNGNRAAIAEATIPPLVGLLRDGSDQGKADAAGVLGAFIEKNLANKAAVLREGGLPPLVEMLRGGTDKGQRNAAWALNELMDDSGANSAAIVAA